MAKSEKKKDEKGEIESAIKHENRHTTTESTLCEVVKTLARIEKKSDEQYKNLTEQIEKLKNSQK